MVPPVGDGAFARWLAASAGEELLALREEPGQGLRSGSQAAPYNDPAALRAAGDKHAHDLLVTQLRRWRPGDAVLSEEGVRDDPGRQSAERVWIVDPLDGTREFGEPDRTDWAVHVALWSRSAASGPSEGRHAVKRPGLASTVGLKAGAVALPAQHRVLSTDQPPPYPPLADPGTARLRLAVSRTRPAPFLAAVAEQVGGELVPMGSAGAKIAAVVTGEVDAYLHAGGQYEWDSAAPVAVALATGLHASRIDGSTLVYNQVDPSLPDLLVCRRDLADRLLVAVAKHIKEH